jgi:hypothetical protein
MAPQVLELEARRLLASSAQAMARDTAFVTNLYQTVLFSEPTAADVKAWTGTLARGVSERAVTRALLHSRERVRLVRALGVDLGGKPRVFVESLYTSLLDQAPHASGEGYWVRAVRRGANREAVVQAFLNARDFPGVATLLSLSVAPTATTVGDAVALTSTIFPKAGSLPATGTVELFCGTTLVATASVSGFRATATTTALPAADDAITAVFLGNGHYRGSRSAAEALTVTPASSATTLTTSRTTLTFGESIRLTAGVTSAPPIVLNNPTVPGRVVFFDGTTEIGTGVLADGGTELTTSLLTAGTHAITAVYQGGPTYATSTSAPITVTVARASTTTAVTASPTSATPGSSVVLTATVATASGSGTPGGTVEFFAGTTDLGPGTLSGGKAILSTTAIPLGSNQITAAYAGDANRKASTSPAVSVAVGQATTTSLNVSPTTATYSNPVALTANVTATGGGLVTGQVEFFDGTTDLGPEDVYQGEAVFVDDTLTGGVHSFKAVYSGDANNLPSTSAPASGTITQAAAQLSLSASQTDVSDGAPVTFTVYVVSSTGNGIPSGIVTFYDGTTAIGTKTLPGVPGQMAVLTTSSLPHGTRTITASYGGDINFGPGTSAPVTVNIGVIGSTTSLSTNQTLLTIYGTDVTLTATVTPNSGMGTPTGTVEFYAGTTDLGGVLIGNILSPNVAKLNSQTIPAGTTSVTAVYKGDSQYGMSTSSSTPLIVVKAPTIVSAHSSATSITSASPVTITAVVRRLFITEATGATGTMTFYEGSTVLGVVPIDAQAEAKLTTSSLIAPGPHFITIEYSGDANYIESPAIPLIINVGQATTTALKVGPTSSTLTDPVMLTATIAPASGTRTPTGTVTFYDGDLVLDQDIPVSNGVATDTVNDIPGGDSAITAVYSGDGTYAESTSAGVPVSVARLATTITLTPSATSSPFGHFVTLTADIPEANSAPFVNSGSVEFFAGTTSLGSQTLGGTVGDEAILFTNMIPLGDNILLTAMFTGDSNFLPSTSAPVPITITPAPTVTSLAASSTSANPGEPVTLMATVTSPRGTLTPPGSADFYDGSTLIGTAPISTTDGMAKLVTTTLAKGSHSLTAVYTGGTDYLTSTSSAVSVDIS